MVSSVAQALCSLSADLLIFLPSWLFGRYRLYGARRFRHGQNHASCRPAWKKFIPMCLGFGCNVPAVLVQELLKHARPDDYIASHPFSPALPGSLY